MVDSDDWLDEAAMREIMAYLRRPGGWRTPPDLVIGNYVYEGVRGLAHRVALRNVFPRTRVRLGRDGALRPEPVSAHACTRWSTAPSFCATWAWSAACVLRGQHLRVRAAAVRTIYYRDVDMYRYYTQAARTERRNESVGRIDQQLRVRAS